MSLQVTMTDGQFTSFEPDEWYPGEIARIEEGDDYGYGPTVRFVLYIDGDLMSDGNPRETWALCSQSLSPRSKLYGWIAGIDRTLIPEPGGTLDLEELAGRKVDVMFEHQTKDDGTVREKVVKMRTSKAGQRTVTAKTPVGQQIQKKAGFVEPDEEAF